MTALRTLLLTCSLGQVGCAPIVYELVDTEGSTSPDPPSTSTEHPTSHGDTAGPSCLDGQWNGDESDRDCGGPCPPCGPGQRCKEPLDCLDQQCQDGTCGVLDCQDTGACPPPGPCQRWDCDPKAGCIPVPDDDGAPCIPDDLCILAGECIQGECLGPALDCNKLAGPCRASACNPATGHCEVEWIAEGEPCEDGLACTVGEQCVQGECSGKFDPPQPVLMTDFSAPDGWTMDPPWQIGPAQPSKCADKNADDPFEDHSPGPDQMLAGAQIGGCLPIMPFPPSCLTSPPLDLIDPPGELWLRYWSVLNTEGSPIESRIDVFDGNIQDWTPLSKFPELIAEPVWTEHILDLTPHVGPGLRIRFCHSSLFQGPAVGGWSLDDIRVGPPMCE